MNFLTKQKETHRLRKQTYGCQEEGIMGVWEGHVHTAIFKTDNQKDLLYRTENAAQYSVIT